MLIEGFYFYFKRNRGIFFFSFFFSFTRIAKTNFIFVYPTLRINSFEEGNQYIL